MNDTPDTDEIYTTARNSTEEFTFDEQVAGVFANMISRSVPGYATVINMSRVLASQYVREGTQCYDLGCSLGATTLALDKGITANGCKIIAVDNSSAMLKKAGELIREAKPQTPVELVNDDIRDVAINNASIITLNFTLQFLPIDERLGLIKKIYQGLNVGGIVILSEKIKFTDNELEQHHIDMHHEFKRANGYNDLEISQKRSALDNVLIPETLEEHQQRFLDAGFRRADIWFQCFNFISIIARK